MSYSLKRQQVRQEVGKFLFVQEEIHGGHGADAQLFKAFGQSRGWFDQAFEKVIPSLFGGDAVQYGADVPAFAVEFVATDARGDGVVVEEVSAFFGIACLCFRCYRFSVDWLGFGEGEVVEPRGAFVLSPAAEEAV